MRTALLALLASTACAQFVHGSGVMRSESRRVPEFAELEVSGGPEVVVRNGPTALVIEGDDNLVALYRTEVKGGRLIIEPRQGWLSPTTPIKVTVTTPHLRRVQASGGVDLTIDGSTDKQLALELSGGVDVRAAALDVDTLDLEASGGVTLDLGGRAREANIELSGGVNLRGKQLTVATAKVEASGGCDVRLAVSEAISGEASGGVNVAVYGNPPKSRLHTSGGADVTFDER